MAGPRQVTGDVAEPPAGERRAALPVVRGQTLQATVVATFDEGVWLGWRGGVFAARTSLQLLPGRSYEFSVARTDPHVVLSTARPLLSAAPVAMTHLSGAGLVAAIQDLFGLLARSGAAAGGSTSVGTSAGTELPQAMRDLLSPQPTGKALQAFDRALGHDQEARVLRLLDAPTNRQAEVAQQLRATGKARALTILDAPLAEGAEPERARATAQSLVDGLSGVERENARRSELGVPLWLPLPANPGAGLRDARMFLQAGEAAGGEADAGERPFTIVLLLDLSQLGEIRVDVALREERVDLLFQVVDESTLCVLSHAREDLQQLLEGVGLTVDQVQVRRVPGQVLPVADLVLPANDGRALVDIHA